MKASAIILLLFGCSFASADTFLIKSDDGGRTWADIDPGPPYQLLRFFDVAPGTSDLYALTQARLGSETHLLVSTDAGQTWQSRQSFPGTKTVLSAGPAGADTFFLAYEDGFRYPKGVIITKVTDRGQTIEQYPADGLTIVTGSAPNSWGAFLTRFLVNPAAPSRLFAVITNEAADDVTVYFQALWTSEDGAHTWRRLEPPVSPNCVYPLIWIAPSDSSVYLSCEGSELLVSGDQGESWTRASTPDGGRIWNLQVGSGTPAILYTAPPLRVLPPGTVLWRSTDRAETWQRSGELPKDVNGVQVYSPNPSVIFGAGRSGPWRSDDGGETWTKLAELGASFQILADPRVPDTLYGFSFERQEPRLNNRQTFLRNFAGEKRVAPGSLVSIYGQDLATDIQIAESGPLPVSLGGVSVFFGGQPAPLLYSSPNQINAQVPFGLVAETEGYPQTASVTMEVRRNGASVDRQTVSLSRKAVFVLRENFTRESAPLLFHASDFGRVTADNAARRGEVITLFALGMGDLGAPLAAGELPPSPPPQVANVPCAVFFERPNAAPASSAPSLWAGAATGLIGVYQVNIEIPGSLNPGSYLLSLTEHRGDNAFSRECRIGYQGDPLDSFTIEVQ